MLPRQASKLAAEKDAAERDQEKAKAIVKKIKDSGSKVQASIQGDCVRVTGKKRDDLQEIISLLKANDFGVSLQYKNFRD